MPKVKELMIHPTLLYLKAHPYLKRAFAQGLEKSPHYKATSLTLLKKDVDNNSLSATSHHGTVGQEPEREGNPAHRGIQDSGVVSAHAESSTCSHR